MALKYPSEWTFGWPYEPLPNAAYLDFSKLIDLIIKGADDSWEVFEIVKSSFGNSSRSSNASWAESDMNDAMRSELGNAAMFVVAFCKAIDNLRSEGIPVPPIERINAILVKHQVPLQVENSTLVLSFGDAKVEESNVEGESNRPTYMPVEEIGRGGFGIVHRVVRTTSVGAFEYAMKIFNPSTFQPNPPRCLVRFTREIRALSQLQHRGIVQILEAGKLHDGTPYILMQLIRGVHLDTFCQGKPVEVILNTFIELAGAMEYAHSMNILHRDLKPSNILVREIDSQPVILDFGCAFILDESDAFGLTTTLVGSERYMPPEVIQDPTIRSEKQDVFALGVMLYDVLASKRFNVQDYLPLAKFDPPLAPVDKIVMNATAKVSERFNSAREMHGALKSVVKNYS